MYEIFLMFPPTKILAPPLYTVYVLYIYVVTCAPPPKFLYVADPMRCSVSQWSVTCKSLWEKSSVSLQPAAPQQLI